MAQAEEEMGRNHLPQDTGRRAESMYVPKRGRKIKGRKITPSKSPPRSTSRKSSSKK